MELEGAEGGDNKLNNDVKEPSNENEMLVENDEEWSLHEEDES